RRGQHQAHVPAVGPLGVVQLQREEVRRQEAVRSVPRPQREPVGRAAALLRLPGAGRGGAAARIALTPGSSAPSPVVRAAWVAGFVAAVLAVGCAASAPPPPPHLTLAQMSPMPWERARPTPEDDALLQRARQSRAYAQRQLAVARTSRDVVKT